MPRGQCAPSERSERSVDLREGAVIVNYSPEYLRKLREQATRERERQTKARALSMQVHKLFSPIEEDVICKRTDSGNMLIDFAHLIDSNTVAKYQNRYSAATRHFKDCQVTISGPWPPYHFMPGKLRTVSGGN